MEPSVVSRRVSEIIADVLGRRPAEVSLHSRLMTDLGAESLDYLDIVFRLEDEFQIKIPRGEIERTARGDLSEEEFAPGGIVSEAGLARLRELLPEAREELKPGLRAATILSLFTVETFARIVAQRIGTNARG
jgi:acyl carrier protein